MQYLSGKIFLNRRFILLLSVAVGLFILTAVTRIVCPAFGNKGIIKNKDCFL